MKNSEDGGRPSASFILGAVALLFLIIGYQAALFIHKASVARIVANHDHPDTVFVFRDSMTFDGAAAGLRPYSAAAKRGWTRPGTDGCNNSELGDSGSLRGPPLSPPRGCRGVDRIRSDAEHLNGLRRIETEG